MNEGTVEERLAALGLTLPPMGAPGGAYVPYVQTGNLLYLSGAGPDQPGYTSPKGKVGADVTLAQAQEAARFTALRLLAVAKDALGSLERVRRVVKLLGMVNCTPEFDQTPQVINGCSELLHRRVRRGGAARALGSRLRDASESDSRRDRGDSRGGVTRRCGLTERLSRMYLRRLCAGSRLAVR